jgi:Ran GTPase-activating protein (RanGAP) involved in mRNA processing and transport/V8-like Glu-specific endopeptidase
MGISSSHTAKSHFRSHPEATPQNIQEVKALIDSRIKKSVQTKPISLEPKSPVSLLETQGKNLKIKGVPCMPSESVLQISDQISIKDARSRVENPENWPFCVHGRLITNFNGEIHVSSGAIVGPQFIITAASNVYDRKLNLEADKNSMRFLPGMNGFYCPFGFLKVLEVFYTEEFVKTGQEDYALLVVERNIGKYTGCYGLKAFSKEELKGCTASLYGYPRVMKGQSAYLHYLWGAEGLFEIDSEDDLLYHMINTSEGQAGSAVYIYLEGQFYIIGVHLKCSNSLSMPHRAIFLNRHRVKRIESWIRSYYVKYSIVSHLNLSNLGQVCFDLIAHDLKSRDFSELTSIDLSRNSLSDVALPQTSKIFFSILKVLDLRNNAIGFKGVVELSKGNLHSLTTLLLDNNDLGDRGAKVLGQVYFENLIKLGLAHNKIGDQGAIDLSRGYYEKLTTLNLQHNQIGLDGINSLANGKLYTLRTLNLAHNRISYLGIFELGKGSLNTLTSLNIAYNTLGDKGAKEFSKGNFESLVSLNMSNCELSYLAIRDLVKGDIENLTSIYLGGNDIGYIGAIELAEGDFNSLTKLYLENCRMSDEGALEISRGNLSGLEHLDLRDNEIGDEGVSHIARGNFTQLTHLCLRGNRIQYKGVRDLAQGNLTQLTVLDLSKNEVGDEGARYLASGKLTALKGLYLALSGIRDEGAEYLAQGNFVEITVLDLSGNLIRDEDAQKLADGTLVNLMKIYMEKDRTHLREVRRSRISTASSVNCTL